MNSHSSNSPSQASNMPAVKPFEQHFIFRMSRMLGVFPFHSSLRTELGKPLLVYSLAVTCTVTAIGGLSVYEEHYNSPFLSEKKGINWHNIRVVFIGIHMLVFPCILIQSFLHRAVVPEAIRTIKDVQSTFQKNKMWSNNNRTKILPLIDIPAAVLCTVLAYVTYINKKRSELRMFYGFTLIGMSLVSSQYCSLLETIGEIFDAGLDFLDALKQSVGRKQHSSRIRELAKAINNLEIISGSVNDIYSLQILVFMALCFMGLSINLYFIAILIPIPTAIKYRVLLLTVSRVLLYFYIVWRVNKSSAETADKSKEFNTLLYQLLVEDETQEILYKEKLSLLIARRKEIVFTACGFFNLDYTLVHSMIAAATTYLVILIQFGPSVSTLDEQYASSN